MKRFPMIAAGAAITAALLLTACSPSGETTSPSSSAGATEPVDIKIGLVPIVDVAPVYVGLEQGFFADEGLNVEITNSATGSALIAGVMSGDLQFGFTAATSAVVAESQGLDLKIVAPGQASTGDPENDFGYILASEGSGIERPKDLEGKSLGTNALKGVSEAIVRNAVEKDGGDPDLVSFVEIPPADTPAALANGQVDAVWIVEPFSTIMQSQGAVRVSAGWTEAAEDFLVGVYFATGDYAKTNPDVVDRFTRAMTKSLEYAQANPDETRAQVATYTEIPQEVVDTLVLPEFPTELDVESLEVHNELAAKYGFIDSEIEVDQLLN